MITDQDTEIIEKEESTHLRLTSEFMNSIGVEVLGVRYLDPQFKIIS